VVADRELGLLVNKGKRRRPERRAEEIERRPCASVLNSDWRKRGGPTGSDGRQQEV